VTDHPTNGLDEVVHQRHRLGILTITAEARRAEFGYLREALDLTPGNLSRHLTVLERAGMVEVEKGYEGRRPRTWVSITRKGRSALAAELDALTKLVRGHKAVTEPLAQNGKPDGYQFGYEWSRPLRSRQPVVNLGSSPDRVAHPSEDHAW
jgi:DNA-binding MarR family transcriptional regulator